MLWHAIAALGASLSPRERPRHLRAIRANAAAFALNTTVKQLVRRPRPRLEGLPPLAGTVSGLSYPSAHAATSFAAASVLGRRWYPLAAAIALSRPYLGVHYPSDVAAGAALGCATARLIP
jgi:membrane-associated phospholipid phosphatase